jgi:nitrogen fixation/metabolism regulation signal transduction histidine kinase
MAVEELPGRAQSSLAGRVAAAFGLVAAAACALTAALDFWLAAPLLAAVAAFAVLLPLLLWLARRVTRSQVRVLAAVSDGITALKDRDFSLSIAPEGPQELSALVAAYNGLGELLRRERLDLYQRELLLDSVIQTTPLAMVLTTVGTRASDGRIIFSNLAARALLHRGAKLEGLTLDEALIGAPEPLRAAIATREDTPGGDAAAGDTLFTLEEDGQPQVYHLSQRPFLLNARPHRLLLLKQLTRELASQEVAVWRKLIRVIAHELNNSLAPVSSLTHSGSLIAQDLGEARLQRVFTTIGERVAHLVSFIDGYARFAKLPLPRPQDVFWEGFLARLKDTIPFAITGTLPQRPARFDPGQLEQVMINLLKNAAESGSPPAAVTVQVHDIGGGFLVEVADRGCGLTGPVLQDALLPFYSTKAGGGGLGLTLCREIIEAHRGRIRLANRDGGGARVSLWLPGPGGSDDASA